MATYGTVPSSKEEIFEIPEDNRASRTRSRLITLVSVFAIALVVAVSWHVSARDAEVIPTQYVQSAKTNNEEGHQGDSLKPLADISTGKLSISTRNEYHLNGEAKMTSYPWEIVEPYRDTFLSVSGGDDDHIYQWTVKKHADYKTKGFTKTVTGKVATFEFTIVGKYSVIVAEMTKALEPVDSSREEIMCKYVRREIRDLTDEDRERFFDAIHTNGEVSTEHGKDIFGSDYYDKNWFIREHMYGGAEITCDHWHSGIGFMATHIAFTLQWEKAIQAVDPRVAAHYWDFTIDREAFGYAFRDSSVFDADWFGEASPQGGIVTEGRWAYTPVMKDAQSFSGITNSWNLLRSPWNNDPTPYMTRFGTLFNFPDEDRPKGCAEYWGCLQKTTWEDLAMCLNGDAHGRIHQLMGGSLGGIYDEFLSMDILKDSPWNHNASMRVQNFLIETEAFVKTLWRYGYMECPAVCDIDTPEGACQCFCDRSFDAWNQGQTNYQILDDTGMLRKLYNLDTTGFVKRTDDMVYYLDGINEEQTEKVWEGLIQATCKPGYIGTMYEGESPNDITFWVLHPNMDKLWHWMRLSPYYFGFDDSWVDGKYGDCEGHYYDDIPGNFTNLVDNDNVRYTNGQLYDLLHPMNEDLPYTYNDFSYSHCDEDFTNLVEDWKNSGVRDGGMPYHYDLRPEQ